MRIENYDDLAAFKGRQTHSRIVAASGCFDVFHVGHLRYLQTARNLGSCVVVGLNSDESVRALKGSGRPINNQDDRAAVLLGLKCVDVVFIFNELRATRFLSTLKPHAWVKGDDYTLETLDQDERKAVESYGGIILFSRLVEGKSSSSIIHALDEQASMPASVLAS